MYIHRQLTDSIGTITLDHFARRNALSQALVEELIAGLSEFKTAGARVVVIRAAAGAKVWSAGHDIDELPQGADPPQSEVFVNLEKTWTAMICAFFATPEKATLAPAPLPAAMPATWVPCQQADSGQLAPAPVPVCCVDPLGHIVELCPVKLLE